MAAEHFFLRCLVCIDFQLVMLQQEEFLQYVLMFAALLILLLLSHVLMSILETIQIFQL